MDARDLLDLIWIVPLLPAFGAALLLVLGRRIGDPAAGWLATVLMGLSFAASCVAFGALWSLDSHDRAHESVAWTWMRAGGFEVDLGLLVDPLSVTMILFVTGVGTLIHLYSIGYMSGDERFGRFFAYMNLFATSMLVLVLGNGFLVTFLGWEGVGLCSYLLVSFWFERDTAAVAGKKAFVTNRIGDVGFLIAIFLIFNELGSLSYAALPAAEGLPTGTATAIGLLLLLGAVGKSAQLPLHVWLPDAMEGPTPVSALIHAATMVTAGVFLVARTHVFFEVGSGAATTVAWVGAITALFAASVALLQNDIKRVLAYSTISQLGYMFLAVGVGAYAAGIFHMVTHAFFKALLFLGAGSVIHGLHDEQDMRLMGGLRRYMPITAATFIVGWLAIAGVFPLAGFWSKDEILAKAWFNDEYALWAVGLVGALLTAFYMTRQVWLVFYGRERWVRSEALPAVSGGALDSEPGPEGGPGGSPGDVPEDVPERWSEAGPPHGDEHVAVVPHESPWTMTVPLGVLAVLSVVGGAINLPFFQEGLEHLTQWLEPVFEGVPEVHASSFVAGLALATASVTVAVVGIVAAIAAYRRGLRADDTDPAVERLGPFATVLERAWFVDDVVSKTVDGPGRAAFGWLAGTVDARVIDGAVDGTGRAVRGAGRSLRLAQTGRVRAYALVLLAGTVLLLAYMLTRAT